MILKIACDTKDKLNLNQLEYFQGDLKDLSETRYKELREEIEKTGFAFPFHVWKDQGKNYLVDGHQRYRVLTQMEKEGWQLPPLPVVFVFADSIEQAKRRVLQATSQYGEITGQGLYGFMSESGLTLPEVQKFELPGIDKQKFEAEFFEDLSENFAKIKEKELDKNIKTENECPSCGYRY